MVKQAVLVGTTAFILVMILYTGVAGAHGKVSMEEDSCMRRAGDNSMVHLSAYQPEHEPSAQYCTEIPSGGETYLVIDLVDQALRDMPVGLKIVRGMSIEDETIKTVKPVYHPDGVMGERVQLEQGRYTIFIKGEGVPPVEYEYPLRVQMINYGKVFRKALGPTIVLIFLTFIGYKLTKTKKVQNWLASKRS